MVYLILIVYIGFTFIGSLVGTRDKEETPESYFLADRNLKTLGLFFTILATNFSAFYFLGFAGEGYKIGYAHYVMMSFGTALAALSFFLIGIPVWRLGKTKGYITPAELIHGETNSRGLSYLFSGVMIVFTLPYLALQIVGGGYILESITDGQISYPLAIILLTLFTIIYVVLGGMKSVAKTDLKQGLLMILFMFLAVFFIAQELGGIHTANEHAFTLAPDLFSIEGLDNHFTAKRWFSFIVFWFFCIPMFPQLFMRFYIAKDIPTLKKSAILYAFIPLVISVLPVMIGVWGHITFPDIIGKASDQILPMMLMHHTSDWFSALVMTGAIAAFMSTLDSQLLALSTMVTRDLYIPIYKKKLNFKSEILIGRGLVVAFAVIGLLIAYQPFNTIFDMGKMAFSGLAILFPVSFFVTRNHAIKPSYAVSSIVIGLLLLFGFYYKIIPGYYTFGFESFIIIIFVCFLVMLFGLKKKK